MTKSAWIGAVCLGAFFMSLAAGAGAAEQFGADRHVKKGIPCQACHGTAKEPAEVTIAQCSGCHPTEALVKKTAKVKPQNPHVSPHYQDQLECTNCHHMHEKTENFCAQCHSFDFKVP